MLALALLFWVVLKFFALIWRQRQNLNIFAGGSENRMVLDNSVISVMMREWWWNLLCEFHLEKIRYSDWLELKMFIYSTKGPTNLGLHIWPQCLPLGRCCFYLLYIHINGFRHGWRKEKCLLVFKPFLQKGWLTLDTFCYLLIEQFIPEVKSKILNFLLYCLLMDIVATSS